MTSRIECVHSERSEGGDLFLPLSQHNVVVQSHREKMAADHFSAWRRRTAVEENQNWFPSTQEAGETERDSEVVLACGAQGWESSSVWISQTFTAELNECC